MALAFGLSGCAAAERVVEVIREAAPIDLQGELPRTESGTSSSGSLSQSTQQIEYFIQGGCLESYEQVGYYGMFEEFNDDCFLVVEIFPEEPRRTVDLQYFEGTWTTEATARTDGAGVARLQVDPICDNGFWCDGAWQYRLNVSALDNLPADRSETFELEFLPE